MKFEQLIEEAINEAKKSTFLHKHGAVIIRDGQVIARGRNEETKIFCHSWSSHAEISALLNLGPLIKTINSDELSMIVVRVSRDADSRELKMSLPCSKCKEQLRKFGIKKVFYSTS